MHFLKKFHLFFGFLVLIIFVLTGQYMHHKYNHLIDMALTERALFRAGHIYILFLSIINISLGSYFSLGKTKTININEIPRIGAIIVINIFLMNSFIFKLKLKIYKLLFLTTEPENCNN